MDNVLEYFVYSHNWLCVWHNEKHASLTPQKRKREQENVMSRRLLIAMINAEFKVGDKDLFIVYERKAKTFLKAPVS